MNIRKFTNDTFNFNVAILWPVTPEEFRDYIRANHNPEFDDNDTFKAICAVHKADDIIIGFKTWEFRDSDLGNLAHETLHATIGMLEVRGITLSEETEECFCYLQNSLFEQSLRVMRS